MTPEKMISLLRSKTDECFSKAEAAFENGRVRLHETSPGRMRAEDAAMIFRRRLESVKTAGACYCGSHEGLAEMQRLGQREVLLYTLMGQDLLFAVFLQEWDLAPVACIGVVRRKSAAGLPGNEGV